MVGTVVLKASGVFKAHVEVMSLWADPSHHHILVAHTTCVQWKFRVRTDFDIFAIIRKSVSLPKDDRGTDQD